MFRNEGSQMRYVVRRNVYALKKEKNDFFKYVEQVGVAEQCHTLNKKILSVNKSFAYRFIVLTEFFIENCGRFLRSSEKISQTFPLDRKKNASNFVNKQN